MIGAGNVATFLATALHRAGHNIYTVYSRTEKSAARLAQKVNSSWTTKIDDIDSGEGIWIFALTDSAVIDKVNELGVKKELLVHTAGSLSIDIFSGHSSEYGVIYPLQTISLHSLPGSFETPICIESNSEKGIDRIRSLASSISRHIYDVSSENRQWLHLAAVFACNFSNHMYVLASDIVWKTGIPFDIFHQLINETSGKAIKAGPLKSQTGPALRNDKIIIKKHLDLLSFSPQLKNIYRQLSDSIKKYSDDKPEYYPDENTNVMGNFKEDLKGVKAFAFDIDGVYADGKLIMGADGELLRTMNIKDGFVTQLAVRKGYPIAIITGGNSESVKTRFNMLGVHDVYLKSSRKLDDFEDFCTKYKLKPEDILYMGDDLPDHPVMERAGFSACPRDAVAEIREIADYISDRNGGEGCVRDVIEQVLRAHGKWMDADSFIL